MEDAPRAHSGTRIAIVALVVVTALPLDRLFTDSIIGVILVAAAGSLGVNALSRRLRLAPILDLLLTTLSLFWLLGILFLRDTLVAGLLPGGATWRGIQSLAGEGAERIVLEVAPVRSGPELAMFVFIGVWATAWLVDTSVSTVGSRLLGIGSALPLLMTPGMLVRSQQVWLDAGAFLLAGLVLLWTDQRESVPRSLDGRRLPAAISLVAVGVSAAVLLLIVPAAPGYGELSLLKSRGSGGIAFNPITALKPTLDPREPRNLFQVRTTRAGYYKLTILDEFTGEIFKQSAVSQLARAPLEMGLDPIYPTSVATERVGQSFQLSRLAGSWLPAQSDPIDIRTSIEGIQYEGDTGALLVLPNIPRLATYQVVSEIPRPSARALDELPVSTPDVPRRFLELPRVSAQLKDIAREITRDADTPYREAVAIQNHLRTFTYDLQVAATHDLRTMEQFLTEVQRGYCEQFATTMAVLARIRGIPSRVVIGFGPGTPIASSGGSTTYQVTTLDAHAWPEIWIEGAGWLRFEPTPRAGFGSVPGYTRPPASAGDTPGPVPTAEPTADPAADPTADPIADPTADPTAPKTPTGSVLSIPLGWVWSVLAVLAMAVVARTWIRRRSRRFGPGGMPPGYRNFLTFCADAGLGRRRGETPWEHAERLSRVPGIDPRPLRDLAANAELLIYGPPGSTDDLMADGARAKDAIGSVLPRSRRLKAAIRANLSGPPRV
ncbi:MAG: transglutaminaseTgpA domain-containing protein [Actinomycetota bacterium]